MKAVSVLCLCVVAIACADSFFADGLYRLFDMDQDSVLLFDKGLSLDDL